MEDEDWTDFATSDFGSCGRPLVGCGPTQPSADEEHPEQLETHMAEMPGAPSSRASSTGSNRHAHCLGRLCGGVGSTAAPSRSDPRCWPRCSSHTPIGDTTRPRRDVPLL